MTDDEECKEFLMKHNSLAELRPKDGHDTAMKMWNDDKAYYMAIYCAHPGDEGYMVIIMNKEDFTFEEASSICLDIYQTPRAEGLDASGDVWKYLPKEPQKLN